jgi:hypothetical protein
MSTLSATVFDDAFAYTQNATLSAPAAGFQIVGGSGTLTVTTASGSVEMYAIQGQNYYVAFTRISLNGSAVGPIVAFRGQPYKGTT